MDAASTRLKRSARQGEAQRFVASYVSHGTDSRKLAPSGIEADAVQAAVLMTGPDDGPVQRPARQRCVEACTPL